MRGLLVILLAVGCWDDAPALPDAGPDAFNDYGKVDWGQWGAPCSRAVYGAETCRSLDGTAGLCVEPGLCMPTCYSGTEGHRSTCPADGQPVYDGIHSQGCYCSPI